MEIYSGVKSGVKSVEKQAGPGPQPSTEDLGLIGADLAIVSVFGRGNWLAIELARKGWSVSLIDVTASLGPAAPEDAEGPFGLFQPPELAPSQKTRLLDENEMVEVRGGLNLWLKEGPIEFHGPLTAFHLAKNEISGLVETYLKYPRSSSKEIERDRKRLVKMPFRSVWPAHFFHQMASPILEENHRALEEGEASPVLSPFSIRQVTSNGMKRGLDACRAAGVIVHEEMRVLDILLAEKNAKGVRVSGPDGQELIEEARTVVWMLTSAETSGASAQAFSNLFPRGAAQAEWSWMRYRFEMTGAASDDALPAHSVVIEDPFLPWANANFFVLRKRAKARHYDVWLRLPMRVRNDKNYLAKAGSEVVAILARRLPQLAPALIELPGVSEAAPLVPIFTERALSGLQTRKAGNLFFGGPEHNATLDWLGEFRHQEELILKLEKLRAAWLAVERKRLAALERKS